MTPPPPVLALKLRPVTEADCRLLWKWVNEPQVRATAFRSEPITWEEHVAWFRKKRSDPNCTMVILLDEANSPLGQVRFDRVSEDKAEIDISIASEQRGCGYGAEAIHLACVYFRGQRSIAEIAAYIKPDNAPSIRAFQKAGFADRGKQVVRGQEAVWMNWEVHGHP